MNATLGKLLYAAVFCLALPLMLAWWTMRLGPKLSALPVLHSAPIGAAIAAGGAALMLHAMWDLWRRGGGLPMNAFPPPRFVATGAYRWLPHPIYAGFGLLVPGVMIALGSRAGLWMVTPVVWLAMVALVVGFERIDLRRRFGTARPRAWLSLPPNTARTQSALRDFTGTALWGTGFIVWCFLVFPFISASRPVDAASGFRRLLLLDRRVALDGVATAAAAACLAGSGGEAMPAGGRPVGAGAGGSRTASRAGASPKQARSSAGMRRAQRDTNEAQQSLPNRSIARSRKSALRDDKYPADGRSGTQSRGRFRTRRFPATRAATTRAPTPWTVAATRAGPPGHPVCHGPANAPRNKSDSLQTFPADPLIGSLGAGGPVATTSFRVTFAFWTSRVRRTVLN